MKIFNLPDLGEGLPDATVREWYVKAGDTVEVDQPMVAMETAKALVDVPAPFAGKIEKLYGDEGDVIDTGNPLIGFEGEADVSAKKDAGTVVGAIEESNEVLNESASGVAVAASTSTRVKATPAVRMLAKQLGVDLNALAESGIAITAESVKAAAGTTTTTKTASKLSGDVTKLSNVRRAMVMAMNQSHQDIVPVTICDDADLSGWQDGEDYSVRILRAIQTACEKEAIINAYFDGTEMAYQTNKEINIGMAVDTPDGLFVPVIKDVANQTNEQLRETINRFKQQAKDKTFPKEDLHGATIVLSNFGSFAGRYANPIIVPPMTCIIGVGKGRDEVVAVNGKMEIHKILPLSVTVDHRAVTGGEAARVLQTLIEALN